MAKKVSKKDESQILRFENTRLKREIEKYRKETLSYRNGEEIITLAVERCLERGLFTLDFPPIPRADKSKKELSEIAVLHVSDVHIGKTTSTFDSSVAAERLELLTSKVLEITNTRRSSAKIEEVRLYLGGDIVEGESIFPGQPHLIDSSVFDQAMTLAPEAFLIMVKTLMANFRRVKIVTVPGNHGRNGGKYAGANPSTNWDRVFYRTLKLLLLGDTKSTKIIDRLEFVESEGFYAVDHIYDWGCLLFHGDQVRGGFGGFPWYGFGKKLWGWADSIDEPWDYAFAGHFHTPCMMTLNHRYLYANGSVESDNDYALEQLAGAGHPCQRLCFFNEDYGLISDNLIYLTNERIPQAQRFKRGRKK